ncbi:MAG: hypothetical protein OEQ13_15205 [Acidobacteriota bacterium]|nr:hypothetical protein [Acidobacteriota bacterium]
MNIQIKHPQALIEEIAEMRDTTREVAKSLRDQDTPTPELVMLLPEIFEGMACILDALLTPLALQVQAQRQRIVPPGVVTGIRNNGG